MKIVIYSTNTCSICVKTKVLLNKWNLPFEQKMIDEDCTLMAEFSKVTNGAKMVPQIVIDDKHIVTDVYSLAYDLETQYILQYFRNFLTSAAKK